MLLVVSNKTDLATDFLVLRLHDRGIPFVRLNTEEYLSEWEVDFSIDSTGSRAVIEHKRYSSIPLESISAAYIRQPKLPTLQVVESDTEFAEREVGEALRSLWRHIGHEAWLNAPQNILQASNKPEQLNVAQNIGFLVPKTCITANSDVIRKFFADNHEDVVVKAVKHGFLYDGVNAKVAATQPLTASILATLDNYAPVPIIVQEHIHKKYDLRVTVIGNKVFPTAIYSQEYKETTVDWRLSDHHKIPLKHQVVDLPSHVEDLCRLVTHKFHLKYSAIDLVLSQDGQYYFLELNPNGQWAWIEQKVGYPIRDAIISELSIGS